MNFKSIVLSGILTFAIFFVASGQTSTDLWPRGVNYQVFVRSFSDSNKDGIGDIKGITSKLDYLKSLGISGLWITPFNVSPSYHKYDITNYMDVDPEYGTIPDIKTLAKEAHKRGIHILMDLVVNHTSLKHPWFLASQKDSINAFRNYYLWANKKDLAGKKNWWPVNRKDTLSKERYYGYFGSNMPDLNYDNPKVREEIIKIGRFWLNDIGIDGFRLDAAQHIYMEDQQDKSRQWWQQFRAEMEKTKKDFFMVGEVWNVDSIVAPYLKNGIHSVFNFDLAATIIKSLKDEKNDSLVIKHQRIMKLYNEMDSNYVDATFLSNHDQNRIASELEANPEKVKLAGAILLTLPGTPYIYYGEELGMKGMKPDEAIREPFLWNVEIKDSSRTKWIKPKYNTENETVPMIVQMVNPASVFNVYKSLIRLRNETIVLQKGSMEPVNLKNPGLLAFRRSLNKKSVIVVHNLTGKVTEFDPASAGLKTPHYLYTGEIKINKKETTIKMLPYSSLVLE